METTLLVPSKLTFSDFLWCLNFALLLGAVSQKRSPQKRSPFLTHFFPWAGNSNIIKNWRMHNGYSYCKVHTKTYVWQNWFCFNKFTKLELLSEICMKFTFLGNNDCKKHLKKSRKSLPRPGFEPTPSLEQQVYGRYQVNM